VKDSNLNPPLSDKRFDCRHQAFFPTRRRFLRDLTLAGGATFIPPTLLARGQSYPAVAGLAPSQPAAPDFQIEISEAEWELSPKRKIKTAAYNGQIPGKLLRVTEGKPVTIGITNRLDHAEIVHWHGQWIPSDVDGSMEEGSPMIPQGAAIQITFTPKPFGLHWYHTHSAAHRDLKRGVYSGQFGVLLVEPRTNPAAYDQEQFLVLHDWNPYFSMSNDGSEMVNYVAASINGRMLGHDDPIQVKEGQRVLFHILNASATEAHWLALAGHQFQVIALDGRPVPTQAKVDLLRLGPAERISAFVTMHTPGVWILGESRASFRDAGMGTLIEYAGMTGKPQAPPETELKWDYRLFGDASSAIHKPDVMVP
jgi:FtsP/CotA-like multicopper oxidase with cupredoxin domain